MVRRDCRRCPDKGIGQLKRGLLGALCVIYGSAIGAASLAMSVRRAVPLAARSLLLPRNLEAWQYLCRLLDAVPAAGLPLLAQGAKRSCVFSL